MAAMAIKLKYRMAGIKVLVFSFLKRSLLVSSPGFQAGVGNYSYKGFSQSQSFYSFSNIWAKAL
jgi:hypothetical protein